MMKPGFYAYDLDRWYMDMLEFDCGTPSVKQVVQELTFNEAFVRVRRSIVDDRLMYDCWLPETLKLDAFNAPVVTVQPNFTVADFEGLKMAVQLLKETNT